MPIDRPIRHPLPPDISDDNKDATESIVFESWTEKKGYPSTGLQMNHRIRIIKAPDNIIIVHEKKLERDDEWEKDNQHEISTS